MKLEISGTEAHSKIRELLATALPGRVAPLEFVSKNGDFQILVQRLIQAS